MGNEQNLEVKDKTSLDQTAEESSAADTAGPFISKRRKWVLPVAAGVVVALCIGGIAIWKISADKQHDTALTDCKSSVAAMSKSGKDLAAMVSKHKGTAAIPADQVKDAKAVIAMQTAYKTAQTKQARISCAATSTKDLKAAGERADSQQALNADRKAALEKAAKTVLASRDAKTLDDAKAELNSKHDEATKLMADSDGRVAADATRENLQKAIDSATSVPGSKAEDYRAAKDALQAAIDQVNASVAQKTEADQQAASQAQAVTPSYQGAPAYGGYQGGGSRGGGQPTPAPAAPTTPAPSGNSGGGFDWDAWANSQPTTGNHGCNDAGLCVIG